MKYFLLVLLVQLAKLPIVFADLDLPGPISPLPVTNASASDPRAILGGILFHDRRFSKNNTISCSSCHNLKSGGADGREKSIGIENAVGDINAPTVFNSGFNFRQFWNGRAKTLEDQLDGPIGHPKEMGSNWEEIIAKLKADHKIASRFQTSYPDGLTKENVKDAIVTFERALTTPNSRFDLYLQGDETAISAFEKLGYKRFQSFGCIACHQGMNIGGNMFQTMGVMGNYFKERGTVITDADLGRYTVTKDAQDKHLFRVPSLRNVALTPPYFHDGSAKTLNRAVEVMAKYQIGRKLSKEETDSIVAFLKTLTGKRPEIVDRIMSEVSP